MRLAPRRPPRPRIPTTPLANLAVLVFGVVVIAGLFAAERGPALRFATFSDVGGFSKEAILRVDLTSEDRAAVQGSPVSPGEIGGAVARALAGRPGAGVLLVVAPDVSYRTMLAAYGAIEALPAAPRVAIPPSSWVEAAGRATPLPGAQ
jgi:hypothetical protein